MGPPVIPLLPGQKRPGISAWQQYCLELPSEALQQQRLAAYPNSNVGLAFALQSGVVVIDIDPDDPDIMAAIKGVLAPYPSPWHRVGKKGKVLAYRYTDQKTFQIKCPGAGVIVEFLSTKRQVVLSPSIHPDTGRPYTANANLYEARVDLVPLPADIQRRLRTVLRPWIGNTGS